MDIVPPNLSAEEAQDPTARNRFAASGLENALKAKPAAFLSKRRAALVEIGNLEDDLGSLADCDWIIEVVIERLDIKRALFKKLESVIKPGTPVTSNTSGLSIADMTEGFSEEFRIHWVASACRSTAGPLFRAVSATFLLYLKSQSGQAKLHRNRK